MSVETVVTMPDFCTPRRGVRQEVDAAMAALRHLGIDPNRVRIERIGGGWKRGTVVEQSPAPGARLGVTSSVVLFVAGPAGVDALPYAMRHETDGVFGVTSLMPVLDAPIARLELYVREAGGFLELRPEDPRTAWRWIRELFAFDLPTWPAERAYPLARLLPALQRVAGTEDGVRVALHTVFDLPVASVETQAALVPLRDELRTRLGERNGRLGVDAVIGDGVTALAGARVTIGPVSLDQYLLHTTDALQRLRRILYGLVLPAQLVRPTEERWQVMPPARGAVVGVASEPTRLGINSRLSFPSSGPTA